MNSKKEYYQKNKEKWFTSEAILRRKEYKKKNREAENQKSKVYYIKNKENKKIKAAKYYSENKEKIDSYNRKYFEENKDRLRPIFNEISRNWSKNNPEKIKEWKDNNQEKLKIIKRKTNLKKKYNLTLGEYNSIFEEQKGYCLGCGKHQDYLNSSLCVDHCHTTGKVRGLLCKKCNLVIGNAQDNINTLRSLISYLEKHQNP